MIERNKEFQSAGMGDYFKGSFCVHRKTVFPKNKKVGY